MNIAICQNLIEVCLEACSVLFAQHCPKHCSYNNPPPSELIGVAALAHPDLIVEIVAVAALPD
jgi:enamine deaminase RidA (YjgF/YER057c/UK114 family)